MNIPDDTFRDLCENANDLIQSVSPEGRFLYVNKAWLEALEYSLPEVEGLSIGDIIHPESLDHCKEVLETVRRGQPLRNVEADFITKSGRRICVEGSISCRLVEGEPVATRGIFRDVSDRKRAEGELDQMVNLSLDLICSATLEGYFQRINPAFEELLGYSAQELLSRPFLELVHPEDIESTLAALSRLASGKTVVDFENRYRAKNGTYKWFSWRTAPLAGTNLIFAVARDVTEAKRIQLQLKTQAAELARSNADLEQFAYAASHDLRAPLRSIRNLADWVAEDLPGEAPEDVKGHLGEMRKQSMRMEALIDDLLDFAQAGHGPTELTDVDVGTLLRKIVALVSPPESFTVEIGPNMPRMRTAKAPLEQVFRNLIGNAIKHHDRSDGKIVISVADVGAFYEFRVSDDGPGIPAEFHERVFQMFQKQGSHDSDEGTGIGLALVKRVIANCGGQIDLESALRTGTSIRFTWPKSIEPGNQRI